MSVVTKRGQTSIPFRLRRELNIRQGSKLVWEKLSDQSFQVRVVSERRAKPNPMAMIGFGKAFDMGMSGDEWMAFLRSGEKQEERDPSKTKKSRRKKA